MSLKLEICYQMKVERCDERVCIFHPTGDDAHWPIPGVFGSQSEANLRTMQHDGYRFGK
jgi:hypothetical protein